MDLTRKPFGPWLCAVILVAVSGGTAAAHPAVGLVIDPSGAVYYSDLARVWRIAPDGRRSVAVPDVHTHELAVDASGVLYGEDSEYLGNDRYRHRIWKRDPDGRVSDVVPWRDGFWRDYGFVVDRRGAMYWTACPEKVCTLYRRGPDGRRAIVARGDAFRHQIQWMAAADDEHLFVIDGDALTLVSPDGRVRILAGELGGGAMGLWPLSGGSVYVAVYGRREVVRVDRSGAVTTVLRSSPPWAPSGILRAPNGDLWVLEYSSSNEARVRRIGSDGAARVF